MVAYTACRYVTLNYMVNEINAKDRGGRSGVESGIGSTLDHSGILHVDAVGRGPRTVLVGL